MAFWNRFPYSNFHEINLDWIIREMKKISGSVSDFARHWEKALKQETGERQEADRQLQENIDAEQDRAEAAEEALDQKIEAETSRAEAAEEALDQKIEAETSRAEEAEKVLDDKITAETNRATEAEEALDQKIEAETSRAEEAEEALDQKIDAETARATEKENDLQEQITAEVNRATAAEGTLDDKIEAETSRATGVENELRGLITTETQRATAAEEALGDRIDGIEGELDGITGADSPFIRKDGTTTTTGKIPLAQGGTSEVDPAAATDLVNLRSMQAADQALESSMTEYVDNQLEAVTGDIHSIPAGGTAGQVLSKVDGTDYNTQWIDPPSGSDPDAIKKDGTTVTTAPIPFARGATFGNEIIAQVRNDNLYIEKFSGIPRSHLAINGDGTSELLTTGNGTDWWGVVNTENGLQLRDSTPSTGTSGQVLTAKGDGTCEWRSPWVNMKYASSDYSIYAAGVMRIFRADRDLEMTPEGNVLMPPIQLDDVPENIAFSPVMASGASYSIVGKIEIHPNGNIVLYGNGQVPAGTTFLYSIQTTYIE